MDAAYHRHDISDEKWAILEPLLPGQRGQWGGINAVENRRTVERSSTRLRKMGYGPSAFHPLAKKRIWEKILEAVIDDPDYE